MFRSMYLQPMFLYQLGHFETYLHALCFINNIYKQWFLWLIKMFEKNKQQEYSFFETLSNTKKTIKQKKD